jgi:hypothetical protein
MKGEVKLGLKIFMEAWYAAEVHVCVCPCTCCTIQGLLQRERRPAAACNLEASCCMFTHCFLTTLIGSWVLFKEVLPQRYLHVLSSWSELTCLLQIQAGHHSQHPCALDCVLQHCYCLLHSGTVNLLCINSIGTDACVCVRVQKCSGLQDIEGASLPRTSARQTRCPRTARS